LGIGWRLAGLTNGKAIFQPAAAGKLQHFSIYIEGLNELGEAKIKDRQF